MGWDGMGWSEREGLVLGGKGSGEVDLGMMIASLVTLQLMFY